MTNLDQFESAFKSSDKAIYTFNRPRFARVLVVTDLNATGLSGFTEQIRSYLAVIDGDQVQWDALTADDFQSVQEVLEQIEKRKPDLIVTYRHLKSNAWQWPYSLGEYLDVMTQATAVPVLVVPHPDAGRAHSHSLVNTDRVMAITDHLTGDDALVNMAIGFTATNGTCWLSHVEDQGIFERYMDTIAKIPQLNTDTARETIAGQLLKEPTDYVAACQAEILAQDVPVKMERVVVMGKRIIEYREIIEKHKIDLLVFHTKTADHLAMNGAAYPLAVGLRQIPLLMI
ncbi:MAG: hypothetical protein HQ483_02585 [Rhodospirillales bacterium]|nr:hypothetical protein [Rhodospirillales bacterium]